MLSQKGNDGHNHNNKTPILKQESSFKHNKVWDKYILLKPGQYQIESFQ